MQAVQRSIAVQATQDWLHMLQVPLPLRNWLPGQTQRWASKTSAGLPMQVRHRLLVMQVLQPKEQAVQAVPLK